jgi:hypothetical protein
MRTTIASIILSIIGLSLSSDAQTQISDQYSNKDSTRSSLVAIFERAIELNQKLRNSIGKIGVDSLNRMRKELEEYGEKYVDASRAQTNSLLSKENDSLLFCTYLKYFISSTNSANESITWDLGELFLENANIFLNTRCGIKQTDQSVLKKNIALGLNYWRSSTKYSKARIDSAEVQLNSFR